MLTCNRNDILRKHGIIPEKPPSPTPLLEEAVSEAERRAHERRLEDKNLDELDALEDEEDEVFLEQYRYSFSRQARSSRMLSGLRKKRLAELSTLGKTSIYNQVYPLQKADYAKEVTEASAKTFVLVHLTSSLGDNVESRVLTDIWRQLATKFGDIKFCEIRADMCIEGYPERNTPTIIIYKDGEICRQIITLRELNGTRTRVNSKWSYLFLFIYLIIIYFLSDR